MREKPTWSGARIRKKGEGMPNYDNNNLFGTLYITFDIQFLKEEFSNEDKESKYHLSVLRSRLLIYFFAFYNN